QYCVSACRSGSQYSVVKEQKPVKGQGVLPCLLVYCLLPGNLKLANKAVHGTNHAKHLEPLDFRCTVWRTGTASGIGTAFFLRMIEMINPSGHETWRLEARTGPCEPMRLGSVPKASQELSQSLPGEGLSILHAPLYEF